MLVNFAPKTVKRILYLLLTFLLLLTTASITLAQPPPCIQLAAVESVEGGCYHETSDCDQACDNCIKVTIRNIDVACNITQLTVAAVGGTGACFNVCTEQSGWTKNRSSCEANPTSVFDNVGGAAGIAFNNTIEIIICSNATSQTFSIVSNCCGSQIQVSL